MRLYFDAILLYRNRSYPTSYLASVIAMEEFGRCFFLSDITFYHWFDGSLDQKDMEKILNSLYDHQHKQKSFRRYTMDLSSIRAMKKVWADTELLETRKQRATYVGLHKVRGDVKVKGHIYSPFSVKRKQSHTAISEVHGIIMELVLGKVYGSYTLDDDNLTHIMTKKLYFKLKKEWKDIPRLNQKNIDELEKLVGI